MFELRIAEAFNDGISSSHPRLQGLIAGEME